MIKITYLSFIFLISSLAGNKAPLLQEDIFIARSVEKRWETSSDFKTPESVYYDKERDIIYVSNINGSAREKDGNGFISKLSKDGKIVKLKWVEGLNAPKGMGVLKNKLFVSDIDALVEIDIAKGIILKKYPTDDAKFLNDIAIDENGVVYVSDMSGNKIYRLKDGTFEVWINSAALERPNGLLIEDNRLLVGTNVVGSLKAIDFKTGDITSFIDNTGGIDGVVSVSKGSYIISDWKGNIHRVSVSSEKEKLIDTTPKKINAADIDYIPAINLLLVPTFGDNRVMAYRIKNGKN